MCFCFRLRGTVIVGFFSTLRDESTTSCPEMVGWWHVHDDGGIKGAEVLKIMMESGYMPDKSIITKKVNDGESNRA